MHPDSNLSASGTQLEAERRCSQKTNIREGRFELPTKGSLRTQMHTLQSSALPLSYPRCADWLCPVCPASKSNRAQPWEKNTAPPLGIEPRTWRLTAARSANGALEARNAPTPAHHLQVAQRSAAASGKAQNTSHKNKKFPVRDLNPGRAGESRVS